MKTKWILTAAVAALLVAPAAMAQPEGGPGGDHHGKMMEKIDTNGDGKVSKEEFMAGHEERFTKADADGDGFLTPDEMKSAWEKMREGRKEKRMEMKAKHDAMQDESHDTMPVDDESAEEVAE